MPTGIYTRTSKHLAQIRKMTEGNKGKKRPPEVVRKIAEKNKISLLGNIPWNKGKKCPQLSGENHGMYGQTHTEEVKRRLSEYAKKRTGDKSYIWKGDKVKYRALHMWVSQQKGKPRFCELCKDDTLRHRSYNWANVSGEYKRDLEDWIRLCVPCHRKFDKNKQ